MSCSLNVSDCRFERAKLSSGSGTVISANISSSGAVNLNNTNMTNCSSLNGRGGGIYLKAGSNTNKENVHIHNMTFTNCSSNSVNGSNVFIECYNGTTFITTSQWTGTINTTNYGDTEENSKALFWVSETQENASKSLYAQSASLFHFIFKPVEYSSATKIYIGTRGADVTTCGWDDLPCLNLTRGLEYVNSNGSIVNVSTIRLQDGNHVAEGKKIVFSTSGKKYEIEGSSVNSVKKYVTSISSSGTNGVFVVSTGSITVTFGSIAFQLNTSSALNYPLFYISQGSLILTSVTVTSASSSSQASVTASIVKVDGGSSSTTSTTINGCSFSLISYSSGNGTCLNGVIGSQDSLTISDTSITSCSGSYGGGIYLSLFALPSFLSLSLSSFTFNTATKGSTLFVYTPSANYLKESS